MSMISPVQFNDLWR